MASPPILTPSGTTGWNYVKTSRTVEAATYQKMVMIPLIEEAERLYGGLTLRKAARLSSTVLAQSAEGTGLTYSNPIGTPVVLTPVGNYVGIGWSENEDAQVDLDINSVGMRGATSALAEMSDQSVLASVPTLTQFLSAASVDGPMFRQAYGRLMGLTNGMANPGQGEDVHAVFSHTQYPNLGTIPEFNNAELRGDSETPYVKGIWMKGGGVFLHMSTVVTNDANGWHNVVFLASAFKISWNVRTKSYQQMDELQHRVILYNNFGSGIMHDGRAIGLRTTASAL